VGALDASTLFEERGLVQPAGVEPTTFGFGDRRSIQLSYGCTYLKRRNVGWGCVPVEDFSNFGVRANEIAGERVIVALA
jgi:hypothetical protein